MNRLRKIDPVAACRMAVEDGLSCGQIARHFECSDQAVSEALRRHGLHPALLWQDNLVKRREAKKAARRAAVAERRRAASQAHYAAWFPLWDAGMPINEMAATLDTTPNAVAWATCMLRRRYGWFPRRLPEYRDPAQVAESWRPLWDAGLSIAQIAQRVGCSAKIANNIIYKMRCRHGWFPLRKFRQAA